MAELQTETLAAQPHSHAWHGQHPYTRLRQLLFLERNDLWVAIIYSAGIGLLSLVGPIATQSLVNTVAFGNLLQPLILLTLVVLIGLLFSTFLYALRWYVVEMIQRRILVRIASETVNKLLRVRVDALDHYHGPELVNRFFDVVTLQKAAASLLVDGLSLVMSTIIGMFLLALYHPWLLAFDVLLLVLFAIVLVPMAAGALDTSVRESKAKYAVVAWLQEIVRNMITFKHSFGREYALDKTNSLVTQYLKYRSAHFRILMRQIIGSMLIRALGIAALLGVGGWLVIQRQLSLGQLVAAEIVVVTVLTAFASMGKQLEALYDMLAAVDKLGYLSDLPAEPNGPASIADTNMGMNLAIRDLDFGYHTDRPVLHSLEWRIEAGERIGIFAQSGSGKTTLFNVLYGLREPANGIIEMDGLALRELKREALRSQVSLIRNPEIFHGTVLENVSLGRPEVDIAEARRALQRAGLLDDVQRLQNGLDTVLSPDGYPLSSGQAIRLMFARALVKNPRLLLVDESLDHLDDIQGHEALLDTLFAEQNRWTIVVASGSPAILERCDRVFTLDNGHLTEYQKA
jgi:ABC-type bacteriocin/lantibiotic exporter with double-glycine peptidase domain